LRKVREKTLITSFIKTQKKKGSSQERRISGGAKNNTQLRPSIPKALRETQQHKAKKIVRHIEQVLSESSWKRKRKNLGFILRTFVWSFICPYLVTQ